jgi:dipeptidase E
MVKPIKKIVAIGGGLIRRNDTLEIDKRIVELSGKKNPRLLLIPTASNDSERYLSVIDKVYGEKLGCKTDALYLLRERPSKKTLKEKISRADIIYVGGGNTLMMMKLWRKLGVDKLLKTALNKGTVLCGISAGAICWFEFGHSDSMSFNHPHDWDYIRVKGTGFLPKILCPHFDGKTRGIKRKKSFKNMISKLGGLGIGIDNHCAIEFVGDKYRIINSKKGSRAFKVFKRKNKVVCEAIAQKKEYESIVDLYKR